MLLISTDLRRAFDTLRHSCLLKTLEECDIYVDGNDLVEILTTIDHDQNGEVDFEEFLNLMTNTDIFIQAVEGGQF